jgi:predicted RNA-binding Zn-ribbon protein involved in translation (DUF1610 family)
MYISPSELAIATGSGMTREIMMKVLRELSKKDVVREVLVVQCPNCGNVIGDYEEIEDVPVEFTCVNCGLNHKVELSNVYQLFKS